MGDPVQNKKRVSRNCLYLSFIGILIILLGISLAYVEWNPKDKDAQIQENNSLKDDKKNLTTQNETLMRKMKTCKTDNDKLKVKNEELKKEINSIVKENVTLKEENANMKASNDKAKAKNMKLTKFLENQNELKEKKISSFKVTFS